MQGLTVANEKKEDKNLEITLPSSQPPLQLIPTTFSSSDNSNKSSSSDKDSQENQPPVLLEGATPLLKSNVILANEAEDKKALAAHLELAANLEKVDPLRPRGMRLFHPNQDLSGSKADTQIGIDHKKQSKLIEKILDPEMKGQGFTFGQFKKLWERLNGKGTVRSAGSGSSHYALLNAQMKVIGGTFAHGDSQRYTKKTVRYLRDALHMIGIF